MGKRVKKKSHAPQKEKRVVSHSPKTVSQDNNLCVDAVNGGVAMVKERKACAHIVTGFDLNNLSENIGSSNHFRCQDCREGAGDRRGPKGKGRHGKKKGSVSIDSKPESKAIWICLECGHHACGGIGLPTTPQSHAVRHARQTHHPLVIQLGNPHLRWCFPCNTLIPVEKVEENDEKKDTPLDVVKLIKARSGERSSIDVEDVWFGGSSASSEIKAECSASSSLEGRSGYVVTGLVNLGNTCFFNAVMQNLLAMGKLRGYFFNQDASFGPLSIALKNLFSETKPETDLKNVINPRTMLGCICSKAPQFKGSQQQDSHELLRCLLDGLSTEELSARKQISASEEDGIYPKHGPTFVDAAFGGQISSTVCCVECGHSSTVYEPFLDLSLSVPTKKPPTERVQPVSRAKKTKPPPKKGGRTRQKVKNDTKSVPGQNTANPSASSELPSQTQSTVSLGENALPSSGDTVVSDSEGPSTVTDGSALVSQNSSAVPKSEYEQVVPGTVEKAAASFEVETFSWMDYVGTESVSDENGFALQNNDNSVCQELVNKDMVLNDGSVESSQDCLVDGVPNLKLDSSVNPWEKEVALQVQSSEVLLLPYKEESFTNGEIMVGEAEASSSVAGCEQDEVGFDGFGDLFNEPEDSSGPVAGPTLGNAAAEIGFIPGNCGESDLVEVDNTDSPVSVESCLAHFIKPELLSNDNAWECENCSKTLDRQRMEAKKKQAIIVPETLINGRTKIERDPSSLDQEISCYTEARNNNNGNIDTGTFLNSNGECFISANGNVDYSNQNCMETESGQTGILEACLSQCEERKGEINAALLDQSHCCGPYESCNRESFHYQAVDSSTVDEPSGSTTPKDYQNRPQFSGNCESEENEDREKTSKKVNVKRDATKRVLINKAPSILTIHLKRFSQDARGRLSKLNGHVNFRNIIDLRPYMDPRSEDVDKYVYRLLGVVEHLGTMRGGHYVAYVRGRQRNKGMADKESEGSVWHHASDAYVREVSLDEVLHCEAYILFYEQI